MTNTPQPDTSKAESKKSVIEVVKGPIGLLALIVLIVEGILGIVVVQLQESHKFYLGLLMAAVLVLVVAGVIAAVYKKPWLMVDAPDRPIPGALRELERVEPVFDVFLAAPMAAFPDNESFVKAKAETMRIVETLRGPEVNATVYYAAESIDSVEAFDGVPDVASQDFEQVRRSRWFLMLYPEKLASSAIAEAGFALAYSKPSVYFVRSGVKLPYLLDAAVRDKKIDARSVEFKTVDDVIRELKKAKRRLFES